MNIIIVVRTEAQACLAYLGMGEVLYLRDNEITRILPKIESGSVRAIVQVEKGGIWERMLQCSTAAYSTLILYPLSDVI